MLNREHGENRGLGLVFEKVVQFLDSPSCPIVSFYKSSRYNDEPSLFLFNAVVKSGSEGSSTLWGGGMAFNEKKAIVKAIGEGIERYCVSIIPRSELIHSSVEEFRFNKLLPTTIITVSEDKKKTLRKFRFNKKSKFFWTKCLNAQTLDTIWLPAQLIYVPETMWDEPIIQYPITTGAAFGISKEDALCRGVCEIVERDAFMLYYLTQTHPTRIDLKASSDPYKELYEYFARYNLELEVFDITTDVGIPVIMAVIFDASGVGPAISIGLKCSFNKEEAVVGAVEEAEQIRPWMRDVLAETSLEEQARISSSYTVADERERGIFWYTGKYLNEITRWLKPTKVEALIESEQKNVLSPKKKWEKVKKYLLEKKHVIYYKEVTTSEITSESFVVVKTVIPSLQPLYLDERYPYFGEKRISEFLKWQRGSDQKGRKPSYVSIPHPFL